MYPLNISNGVDGWHSKYAGSWLRTAKWNRKVFSVWNLQKIYFTFPFIFWPAFSWSDENECMVFDGPFFIPVNVFWFSGSGKHFSVSLIVGNVKSWKINFESNSRRICCQLQLVHSPHCQGRTSSHIKPEETTTTTNWDIINNKYPYMCLHKVA